MHRPRARLPFLVTDFVDDVGEARDEHFTGEIDLDPFRIDLLAANEVDGLLRRSRIEEIDETLRGLRLVHVAVVDVDIEHLIGRQIRLSENEIADRRFGDVQRQIIQPEHVRRLTLAESQLEQKQCTSVQSSPGEQMSDSAEALRRTLIEGSRLILPSSERMAFTTLLISAYWTKANGS